MAAKTRTAKTRTAKTRTAKKRAPKKSAKKSAKGLAKPRSPGRAPRAAARASASSPLAALRRICLALPESKEVLAWGTSTFRCGKIFAMYAAKSDHHGGGRDGVWLKAALGVQELMIRDRPDRFFKPPYVGPSGWIGVWLDKRPDWTEVAELVEDSWRLIAPKKLVAAHRD